MRKHRIKLSTLFLFLTLSAVLVKLCMLWANFYLVLMVMLGISLAVIVLFTNPKSVANWSLAALILYLSFDGPVCGYLTLKNRSVMEYRIISIRFGPQLFSAHAKKWEIFYLTLGVERSLSSHVYGECSAEPL
jgi:hypothetical protein